jgi:hypothetical protein
MTVKANNMSDDSLDDKYERVGYGKPPKHTRFKKGQSGNPKGRKPRSRNTSTLLREELESIIEVHEGGRTKRLTKREALIKTLVNDAITGKNQARPLLLKIIEIENPPEPFEASHDDLDLLQEFISNQRKSDGEPHGES